MQVLAGLFHDRQGEYPERIKAKPEVYDAVRERTKVLVKKVYALDDYAPVQQPI